MPIDPRIALGFQSPQFESPLGLMSKLTEMSANANQNRLAQAKLAAQNMENEDNATINALAAGKGFDINNPQVLQQLRASPAGRKFITEYYKGESERSAAAEADDKVINSELNGRLAALESFDPQDPNLAQRLMAWRQGTQGNAHLQSWMQSHGIQQPTDEQYAELVKTPEGALQQYKESLRSLRGLTGKGKPKIEFQTTNQGIEGIDTNPESSSFGQSPIRRGAPPRPAGNIFNIGDKGFGKVLGEGAGKDLTERYNTANDAVESYRNTNDLYKFVNSPDFISGSMGEWRAKAAKFLGLSGVAETDAYFAQKGRDVAKEARQFGTGASVTDNDRKYAEQIGAGSRELTPEGIRLITYASQMLNRYKIKKYNERRAFLDRNNPDQNIAGFYEEIPVPPPPAFNGQGWELHRDKNGNYAYVGPGKNQVQEVQ